MPELPEVEVVKQGLVPHLVGRRIVALHSSNKKLRCEIPYHEMVEHLIDEEITNLERRAKYLIVEFSSGGALVIHLGMTGKLGIVPVSKPTMAHDHVIWQLDNQQEIRFNDVRRFGSIQLLSPGENSNREQSLFSKTGPEPFDSEFTGAYLKSKAAGRRGPIKSFLMNNTIVAGIGNIYANESLFAAGIRPRTAAGRISRKQYEELVFHIRSVLTHAIKCGGSTINDFLGASGEKGYFQINFNVYGKKDQQCMKCGSTIKAVKVGGRASFYCPQCQQ